LRKIIEIAFMPNFDPQTVQLIIVAAVALALSLQTIFLLAILIVVRKQARSIREDVEDLRTELMPIIHNARELFVHVAPKIEAAAGDLSALAHGLRSQAADVQSSAAEVLERLRRQAGRVDAMTSTVLDAIDRASAFMTDAVAKPMRQLSALLASVRAVVESLRTPEPPAQPQPTHLPEDKDMFV
jgi:hypothetical protein